MNLDIRSLHSVKKHLAKPKQDLAISTLKSRPEWEGVLHYNEINLQIEALKPTPWGYTGPWNDIQDTLLVSWYDRNAISITRELAMRAAEVVAMENKYNPIQDYIKSLVWDGKFRINGWLINYAGVEDTGYSRTVGEKWLISAIARAIRPGCKVDTCLILEGPQGKGKSSLLKTISEPFYSDDIADFGSKDAVLQMQKAWIIELAELDSLTRSETSRIKAFMSRATDNIRPPYGRHTIAFPRHCVFAGTANHSDYLKDESGARRFWPVVCGEIELDLLKAHRDQLWAEAYVKFKSGETWWLEDEFIIQDSERVQLDHHDYDPWYDLIEEYVIGKKNITVANVLEYAINKPSAQWTQSDKTRVGRCLTLLGGIKKRKHGQSRTYDFDHIIVNA